MKGMLKDAAILFAITLIAGVLLGSVYQITKEPIARQEAQTLENACREVFPQADSFAPVPSFDEKTAQAALTEGGYADQSVEACQQALAKDGSAAGYVLTINTREGYGGDIRFTMGIAADGTLNGISLLEISETPGLGMRAEEVLVPQFQNRRAYPFVYVKSGASSENEIDAISGATITTNAVTNGVNAGMYYFQQVLEKNGEAGGENE